MYCKKCGSEIAEGQSFCGKCGAYGGTDEAGNYFYAQAENGMGLHCPRCGKTQLQVQSNNKIVSSTSMSRAVGRKHAIGRTMYDTAMETYWFCNSCGMKFRDLDELKMLIKTMKKKAKIGVILMIIAFVVSIVGPAIEAKSISDFFARLVFYGFLDLLVVFVYLSFLRQIKKHEKEYNDLLPKVRRS